MAACPWVPLLYLLALIALPLVGWRVARWRTAPWPVRWSAPAVAALSVVALCPVPWLKADLDHPPGSAWQLDGRLEINGTTVDPPGTWYWLTVGRPPIVAELVKGWLFDEARRVGEHAPGPPGPAPGDLRTGGRGRRAAPCRLAGRGDDGRRGQRPARRPPARARGARRAQRTRPDDA